jgi:hypothetical protein
MTENKVHRRDFLKIAAVGVATVAGGTGNGQSGSLQRRRKGTAPVGNGDRPGQMPRLQLLHTGLSRSQ